MKHVVRICAIFLICFTFSCHNKQVGSTSGIPDAISTFARDEGLISQFLIHPHNDTILRGASGTILEIPAGVFNTTSDQFIEIELVEGLSTGDLVLFNAQTVSEGQLLTSGGVVYIGAKQQGEELQLAENKRITVKIPSELADPEMKYFKGAFDQEGKMNWQTPEPIAVSSIENRGLIAENPLFLIPFDVFPNKAFYYQRDSIARLYEGKSEIKNSSVQNLIGPVQHQYLKRIISIFESSEYNDTYIATAEFADRLLNLSSDDHTYHISEPDEEGNWVFAKEPFAPYQLKALDIYLTNTSKPLYVVDSMVYEYLKQFKLPYYSGFEYPYSRALEDVKKQIEYYRKESEKKITYPIKFDEYQVDFDSENIFSQLIERGVSPEQANLLIQLHQIRKDIITSLSQLKDSGKVLNNTLTEGQTKTLNVSDYYTVEANQLGWINIDKFYDIPVEERTNLLVELDIPEELEFVQVLIALKDSRTVLTGTQTKAGQYIFNSGYPELGLPKGEPGVICAISVKGKQKFLGFREITLGEEELIQLKVNEASDEFFKRKLSSI